MRIILPIAVCTVAAYLLLAQSRPGLATLVLVLCSAWLLTLPPPRP